MQDNIPLPEQLRPQRLDEIIGQSHLVGKNGLIRKLVERNYLPSLIFWGPPGCGKTSLALVLAQEMQAHFEHLSAVTATLSDVRQVLVDAEGRNELGQRTILFLDEIHRFNKAQQDALLPSVEKGTIIFIGATTENPSFEINAPLLSRCRVVVLQMLDDQELQLVLQKGLQTLKKTIASDAQALILSLANGDARSLLSILAISSQLADGMKIVKKDIEAGAQKQSLRYDTTGQEHYNTISAFIKSMRASDVDASLYYLARMVEAGEDPQFIARRMVIFASEDIGLAQPTALVVANAVFEAVSVIGYPEAQINLAHGAAYLAQAKKDRRCYDAYMQAREDVQKYGNLPIPLKLRNAPTKLMKDLSYGKGYEMYTDEDLLPEKLHGKKYLK